MSLRLNTNEPAFVVQMLVVATFVLVLDTYSFLKMIFLKQKRKD